MPPTFLEVRNWCMHRSKEEGYGVSITINDLGLAGADPGFLSGEGAKELMTLYGMGMNDF